MSGAPANFNAVWARTVAQELARGGVRSVAIAPGSRSAPLAFAIAAEPSLRAHVVIDERSAAFLALGAAKASGRPAAVLATSGSAGGHFLPAALEAEASGVPLVLLTADRPPELHGFGAPQTLDQQALFGGHVRLFADLGPPEPTDAALLHLRAVVSLAVSRAQGLRPGPVHINAPFREPLAPIAQTLPAGLSLRALEGDPSAPSLAHLVSVVSPAPGALDAVAAELARHPRGVIVCGPRDRADELPKHAAALSAATGYPILAEAASNLRQALPRAIATYDTLLRHQVVAAALRPDAVIRLGGGLTSKVLQGWLDTAGAYTVLVTEGGRVADPSHAGSIVLDGDASITCEALARRLPQGPPAAPLAAPFAAADATVRATFESAFSSAGDVSITEPRLAREVAAALPDDGLLFVSSSMPIRDLDAFATSLPARSRVLANRGLNGIDGIVSTALGASLGAGLRTVALLGDVALLHDLSGLVAARRLAAPLVLVVPNNDGGGIFHFLPVAAHADPASFETLFGTPHGIDLASVASLAGAQLHRPRSAAELRAVVREASGSGLHLVEVRTERRANVAAHRALQGAALAGLEGRSWA